MKILFCPHVSFSRDWGASKVVIEVAEEMALLGWECKVVPIMEMRKALSAARGKDVSDAEALHLYLKENAHAYDVVDYDHAYLPFPRGDFPERTLFVARSVLLTHHLAEVSFPRILSLRSRVKSVLLGWRGKAVRRRRIREAHRTVEEADAVNVSNHEDHALLVRQGIAERKIITLPFGIDEGRRAAFDALPEEVPAAPCVAFIGSFDFRKGAADIPGIVEEVIDRVPEVSFRFLGTAGLYQTEGEVRACFPARFQDRLTIVPKYKSEELPGLLLGCSVGMFPSYLEGFGIGVIEMLASAIPVVAYDAPGPSSILSAEFLVPRGDKLEMARRLALLLADPVKLREQRAAARAHSRQYSWREIARQTSEAYSLRSAELRGEAPERATHK